MSGFRKKTINSRYLFTGVALILFTLFTTCDIPMGLGDPIDWEPPVLTLDGSSIRYVQAGAVLTGTVTDNLKVDRVILRDASTEELLFTAKLLPNDRWEIVLNFDESYNGGKLSGQIIAYDSFGNNGDTSMASITLWIDVTSPLVEEIWVQRTDVRKADLENYGNLKDLELTGRDIYGVSLGDPLGEEISHVNKYQNGVFWIRAEISEGETRIKDEIKVFIYDEQRPNTPIFTTGTERNAGSTTYNPIFTFDERDILAAGNVIFGSSYTTNYDNGARYYYRVRVVAEDLAGNPAISDQKYFCMWKTADKPKGVLVLDSSMDPNDITLPKGSSLPIVFFDDDTLEHAFAFLLTQNQWGGTSPIATTGTTLIPSGTDEEKLTWLAERLIAGTVTYDWTYEKRTQPSDRKQIPKIIPSGTMDEKYYDVTIGNQDNDYGNGYRLVTVARDIKLKPHGDTSNSYAAETVARVWEINVIDENAPLIVFDKTPYKETGGIITGGCPEENTFPELKTITGGTGSRYFEIAGYTLRENITGTEGVISAGNSATGNRVINFRMAWIPYGMPGGSDSHIAAVREALEKPNPQDSDFPAGVQWWTLKDEDNNINYMTRDENEKVSTGMYRRQSFRKTFDVTGEKTDFTGNKGYKHFFYNDQLQNETKLFLFYAEDNMGHGVHSQLYLLGQKAKPTITVYDLTNKNIAGLTPPDINSFIGTDGTITESVRRAYQVELDKYNKTLSTYTRISGGKDDESEVMLGLKPYPRNTITTYWVVAKGSQNIALKDVMMEDVTNSVSSRGNVGYYNSANGTMSYTELHPEVTQRTFRFTAIDELDNEISIQRTVLITNGAILTEITTSMQNGEYGIEKEIVLQARFSGFIQWLGTEAQKPTLNVRYENGGTVKYDQLKTTTPSGTNTLFLEFKLKVDVDDGGQLQTLYANTSMGGNIDDETDRPIKTNGARIIDAVREDTAFLPGYASGFIWSNDTGSLQKGKNIRLNGIRPVTNGTVEISGKSPYTAGEWYFKNGETIEFTISSVDTNANNLILPGGGGKPQIRFYVSRAGGTYGPFYADWQRSSNAGRSMVFSVPATEYAKIVNDGEINSVSLYTDNGTIVNGVGNRLINADKTYVTTLTLGGSVFIDKTPPKAPVPSLNGSTTINSFYGFDPTLTISDSLDSDEPWGVVRKEYSLNNGFDWVTFPTARTGWTVYDSATSLKVTSGDWIMRTRYVDKAGNEGVASTNTFSVNSNFPELRSITAVQSNGIYPRDGTTLRFNFVFSDTVKTDTPASVTITLSNRAASPTATQTHQLTAPAQNTLSNTIYFEWTGISDTAPNNSNKEMLNGLYVSAVEFGGLRDKYGNAGGSGSATTANDFRLTISKGGSYYNCNNLNGAGIIVDCIAPTLSSMAPTNAAGGISAASVMSPTNGNTNDTYYNRRITLTFSEPVQAGKGTITVKPHGAYFIPPVFENDSYYLEVRTGNRSSTIRSGYTKITGFYDVYNATTITGRSSLAQSTNTTAPSMTALTLDARTGQSAGPYIKMTQGLKEGRGYSGNYNNNMTLASSSNQFDRTGYSGPNVDRTNTYMVPDTATKWVLDYKFSINSTTNTQTVPSTSTVLGGTDPGLSDAANLNTAVSDIRKALTAAKFRWQELDVTSSSVTYNANRTVVTITLPEALENGLQWDICYPSGTFTDLAGHNAPGMNHANNDNPTSNMLDDNGNSWFISNGVQTPVIRVNRKSFDARVGRWNEFVQASGGGTANYQVPANRTHPGGWGIGDFNTVHYRIETETPGATIAYATIVGTLTDNNSVYIATGNNDWGAVPSAGGTNLSEANWYDNGTTRGNMIRPNLIRRASTNNYWDAIDENGISTRRNFTGNHAGFRSYNKDALATALSNLTLPASSNISTPVSSGIDLYFTYEPTEASKNYVVAEARVDYGATVTRSVKRGYEGVYRSVVAMLQENNTNPLYAEGSNVKNGMPSIAGFPVRDAEESGDNRYIKYFYNAGRNAGGNTDYKFYWVSTEIVSDWYFIKFGNGQRHQTGGKVIIYLSAGYGDLTFAYRAPGSASTPW